jgi:hypothetical protein
MINQINNHIKKEEKYFTYYINKSKKYFRNI